MIYRCIAYWRKRPALLRRIFFGCLAGIACAGILARPEEPHLRVERVPLVWALFGLAGCVVLALGSKWIARTFLERDTDYYDS